VSPESGTLNVAHQTRRRCSEIHYSSLVMVAESEMHDLEGGHGKAVPLRHSEHPEHVLAVAERETTTVARRQEE
jgi:hypothetical protein